jgi:hypothetical protein
VVFLEFEIVDVRRNTCVLLLPPPRAILAAEKVLHCHDRVSKRRQLASALFDAIVLVGDPQTYLAGVLERIVSGRTKSHQLHELLAWNWKAARELSARVAA